MASTKFLILNSGDPKSLSQARSHAMTQWRRARAQESARSLSNEEKLSQLRSIEGRLGVGMKPRKLVFRRSSARDWQTGTYDLPIDDNPALFLVDSGPLTPLGAGKLDPFQSFAVPIRDTRAFELLNFCATEIFPSYLQEYMGCSGSLTCAWIPAAMRNPAYFHACLMSTSVFLEHRFGKNELHASFLREQLGHKVKAMHHVRTALANKNGEMTDETILAIYQLACNEFKRVTVTTQQRIPTFSPLLQSLQWLDLYGNIEFVEEHWLAFVKMLDNRGGLDRITLDGVKDMIRVADCLRSSKILCEPYFAAVDLEEILVKDPPSSERFYPMTFPKFFKQLKERGSGHGFHALVKSGISADSEAIAAFCDLSVLSSSLEAWSNGLVSHPYMADIASIRLSIQHRLLSLPTADDPVGPHTNNFSYEACRLTALLYAVSVTFPIPPSGGPQAKLVAMIREALEWARDDMDAELQLWCLTVGGIAAAGLPERVWFAGRTGEVCRELIVTSWRDLREVLKKFAWLEISCEAGGRAFLSLPQLPE